LIQTTLYDYGTGSYNGHKNTQWFFENNGRLSGRYFGSDPDSPYFGLAANNLRATQQSITRNF